MKLLTVGADVATELEERLVSKRAYCCSFSVTCYSGIRLEFAATEV
jgi:hypothetical protein